MTLYQLKPGFQALLRPLSGLLARSGVTANQVTVFAAIASILIGGFTAINANQPLYFLLIPIWMLLRMVLNAVDGMLARDFNQASSLGAYLNELCDVVSDVALFLPFAFIAAFNPGWVALVILLAVVSEFAGALGLMVGASRRYDGPAGKSDRALVFGATGLAVALAPGLAVWFAWAMPILALLLCLTIFNRVRNGLTEAASGQTQSSH